MQYNIVRYFFNLSPVYELLESARRKYITFFLDISSISRGIYSSQFLKSVAFLNTDSVWFDEIYSYIGWLRNKFKKYEPFFILFFDNGYYTYHLSINQNYKSYRFKYGYIKDKYFSLDLKNFVQHLKKKTWARLLELNGEKDIVSIFLKDEEADAVPYFFISNDFLETRNEKNLNVILSSDKDLLQTLKFENTVQIVSKKKSDKFVTEIFTNQNAIEVLIQKENDLKLNAEWVSYFLAVCGDRSDGIQGAPKFGYKTFYNKLKKSNYTGAPKWNKIFEKIPELKNYKDLILNNFKLVDFEQFMNSPNGRKIVEKIKKLV